MLSEKNKELIDKLINLTVSNELKWEKFNTPTSLICKSGGIGFVTDRYKTKDALESITFECCELAILKNEKIIEDLVFCDVPEFTQDFAILNNLYQTVYKKYIEKNDVEISDILSSFSKITYKELFEELQKSFSEKTNEYLKKEKKMTEEAQGFMDKTVFEKFLKAKQEWQIAANNYNNFLSYAAKQNLKPNDAIRK